MRSHVPALLFLSALLFAPGRAQAQAGAVDLDTVRAGRFDMGKMWTFENAPTAYFTETYGFNADAAWFEEARLAALRIPGCSAAFVSPNGLVVTNHHCVRGSAVVRVTREGESLLDDGFYAPTLEEERPIPNYYVDQLIAAEDVSEEVFAATDRATTDEERQALRQEVFQRIQERIESRHQGGEGSVRVEVTALYNGGRYSAYTYRRYTDVRLVAAAELQMGFFGGDGDNFTYPRYALDFAFMRVYGSDGEPLNTDHFFSWSEEGVEEGSVIFVIGNPGPTNRLNTLAQLAFQRDVSVAANKAFLGSRLAAMREFYRDHPAEGDALDLRNQMFGLSNSLKANTGRLEALEDPVIMARKADGERLFREALASDPALQGRFGEVLDRLADIQERKRQVGPELAAFASLGRANTESSLLLRGLAAANLLAAREIGAPPQDIERLKSDLLGVTDHPDPLEEAFLAERLQDFLRNLGPEHPVTQAALGGRSVEGAVTHLRSRSVLSTREGTEQALNGTGIPDDDPGVFLAGAILPTYLQFTQTYRPLTEQEEALAAELGRARYAVYGPDVPPDASRSPRITDGQVLPYEYNGTLAPVYTTFFGLYDHYFSYGPETEWNLPSRWLPPHPELDLRTPLNFISTADTYGGNSGSPAVTPGLEIVGLNFDRNIEGLSRDFILLPERGRNIMVDVRAIKEAMDKVYDADRIVQEILTHRLFRTEAEADAAGGR
ncbi:MAG: S46 family peptidase [Longimicrobiales bacterium]